MILRSRLDASVNHVALSDDGGAIESRWVYRANSGYAIVYVSSATGCRQACRFCHLTQAGQTMDRPLSISEMADQVATVMARARADDHLIRAVDQRIAEALCEPETREFLEATRRCALYRAASAVARSKDAPIVSSRRAAEPEGNARPYTPAPASRGLLNRPASRSRHDHPLR